MSRLENLSPDLHAVLSLLLRQRKSYAELATLLGIQEHAVHDRAHAALALLAPREARALSAAERERVGEYLLGAQDASQQQETRAYLQRSTPARAWAQALSSELAPLAPAGLAELPAHAAPSSRLGGAMILGGLAVVAIVAVLLIVGVGGGGGSSHTGTSASATGSTGTPTGSTHHTPAGRTSSTAATGSTGPATGPTGAGGTETTPATGTATGSGATHGKAMVLTPDTASSKAVGAAYVLSEQGQRAFYVFAKELPPTTGGEFYAVWLEGASSAAPYPLGSLPAATSSGIVEGGGPLPSNAGSYTRIVITTETSHKPAHPGPTVLGGRFTLAQ